MHINDDMYLDEAPEIVSNFCIVGYQPEIKWLKVWKGECLSYEDSIHKRKILMVNLCGNSISSYV